MKAAAIFVTAAMIGFQTLSIAQSGAVYVGHDRVTAALSTGKALMAAPDIRVEGGHRDKPGPLSTEAGTTVIYVTDGAATLLAGGVTHRISKGDVAVVPAHTPAEFKELSSSLSYLLVYVPTRVSNQTATTTVIDRQKVEPTFKKAGPLADGPNMRVSGGYRTGPYAPDDYRPDVEVHATEGDLFYVIDGDATLITGGSVIGGRTTAPGQIRGSRVEGGESHHLTKGDVMWVPAGVPHWFPEIPHPLGYLLVKVL